LTFDASRFGRRLAGGLGVGSFDRNTLLAETRAMPVNFRRLDKRCHLSGRTLSHLDVVREMPVGTRQKGKRTWIPAGALKGGQDGKVIHPSNSIRVT